MYVEFWNNTGCFIMGTETFRRPKIPLIFSQTRQKNGRHHSHKRPSLMDKQGQENQNYPNYPTLRSNYWRKCKLVCLMFKLPYTAVQLLTPGLLATYSHIHIQIILTIIGTPKVFLGRPDWAGDLSLLISVWVVESRSYAFNAKVLEPWWF